jgi:hypothetical protein
MPLGRVVRPGGERLLQQRGGAAQRGQGPRPFPQAGEQVAVVVRFVSGFPDGDTLELTDGRFLPRPYVPADLVRIVRRLLDGRP